MRSAAALVKLFEEHGFTLVRSKNHMIWRCPCGHGQVSTSKTPSDPRAPINAKHQVIRMLRACTPKGETTP